MAGTRLKEKTKRKSGKPGVNALLVFLAVVLALLVAVMLLTLRRNGTQEQTPSNTVSIGGQQVEIDETLPQSTVEQEEFVTQEDGSVAYQGEAVYGIDVSAHQGEIDWAAAAADGTQFAMLRIGFRGYTAGAIQMDERFEENYAAARENGLMVGVYFFSQAVSEQEAAEEAAQVLAWLDGRELECPVAYDWEPVENQPDARTNDTDGETVTACARAFCTAVQAGGYRPMLYCNGMLGYLSYDVSRLTEFPIWYAEYGEYPSYAYAFEFWQYTDTGSVAGVQGNADRDIWFRG